MASTSYPIVGPTVTTPLTGAQLVTDRQVVTTTVTETRVRGRRIRLFVSGFLQLIFGGFALIPVLILAPNVLTIVACAWLAFTGMVGCLGACVSSNKSSTSVKYNAATRTQQVMTVPPMFPRFYMGMMIIGFLLAVATAIQGIVFLSADVRNGARAPWWYVNWVMGPVGTGVGIFFALNQMIMICCVSPMVRSHTSSSEQVHTQPGLVIAPPPATYGAYQPQPGPGGPHSSLYPYIDEPIRENPPPYSEAMRNDYPQNARNDYPQKTPTAPDM